MATGAALADPPFFLLFAEMCRIQNLPINAAAVISQARRRTACGSVQHQSRSGPTTSTRSSPVPVEKASSVIYIYIYTGLDWSVLDLLGWNWNCRWVGPLALDVGLLCKNKKQRGSARDRPLTLRCLSQFFPNERKDQLLRG